MANQNATMLENIFGLTQAQMVALVMRGAKDGFITELSTIGIDTGGIWGVFE